MRPASKLLRQLSTHLQGPSKRSRLPWKLGIRPTFGDGLWEGGLRVKENTAPAQKALGPLIGLQRVPFSIPTETPSFWVLF